MLQRIVVVLFAVAAAALIAFYVGVGDSPPEEPTPSSELIASGGPLAASEAPAPSRSETPSVADDTDPPQTPDAGLPAPAESPPRVFTGTVSSATSREPILGAVVTFSNGRKKLDTQTDADGNYRLEVPAADFEVAEPPDEPPSGIDRQPSLKDYALSLAGPPVPMVSCVAEGYARKHESHFWAQESGVNRYRVDFALVEGAALSGRVTVQGEHIPGARIVITAKRRPEYGGGHSGMISRGPESIQVPVDLDGYYEMPGLEPDVYDVRPEPETYIATGTLMRTVTLHPGEHEKNVDFSVEPAGVVEGTVLDLDVKPVENALVDANCIRVDSKDLTPEQQEAYRLAIQPAAVTGSDGRFRLQGLSLDVYYRIMACQNIKMPLENRPEVLVDRQVKRTDSDAFLLTRAQPIAQIDITLLPGSTVSGAAVYEDGRVAQQVKIYMHGADGGLSLPLNAQNIITDEHGRFSIAEVPAGAYKMRVTGPTAGSHPEPPPEQLFEVDGVNPLTGVRLIAPSDLLAADGIISGRVEYSNGSPAEAATVIANVVDGTGPTEIQQFINVDEDGHFVLPRLYGEAYDLRVVAPAGEAELSGVVVGSDVLIQIEPTTRARIEGTVVGPDGTGVFDAAISLLLDTGAAKEAFPSHPDGTFQCDHLDAGTYTIRAMHPEHGAGESEAITVAQGETKTGIVIRLQTGGRFSGRVQNVHGGAVPEATVSLYTPDHADLPEWSRFASHDPNVGRFTSGLTDTTGEFEIASIPPGDYRLLVTHPDYANTFVELLTIPVGRDVTNYRITLYEGGCIAGNSSHGDADFRMQVFGAAMHADVTTDADGRFELCGLAPGTYTIVTMNAQQTNVEVFDGQISTVDLAL